MVLNNGISKFAILLVGIGDCDWYYIGKEIELLKLKVTRSSFTLNLILDLPPACS